MSLEDPDQVDGLFFSFDRNAIETLSKQELPEVFLYEGKRSWYDI